MKDSRENRLIWRIQKRGSRHSADELIRMYYREIYAYAYKQLGEKGQAMDITQEIFISMLKSIMSFNSEKSNFRTWLYSIATHKIIDYYRSADYKHISSNISLDGEDIQCESDFFAVVSDKEIVEKIMLYIRSQDVIVEEIFRLRFYGEYTFQEISEMTKIPLSTVKTKYYKTVQNIRKIFRNEVEL